MNIAVIGGGAAGLMAAIVAAEQDADVTVFEKSSKFLSKVKISGGGRCNVTHQPLPARQFLENYPRGKKILKKCLPQFDSEAVMQWFEDHGVPLKTEADGRVFPVSDRSASVMDALLNTARELGVKLRKKARVWSLLPNDEGQWTIAIDDEEFLFDKVIVATGGSPQMFGFSWLSNLDLDIVPPVPSLFTFNIGVRKLYDLMGLSMENAQVKVDSLKFKSVGPVLITHWGISGPAVLKISSFAARELNELGYDFWISINWISDFDQESVRQILTKLFNDHPHKKAGNVRMEGFPDRLWSYLLERSDINPDKPAAEVGSRMINRLVETVCNDRYRVQGKTTFKDEFVTAGGISESEVDPATMECRKHPGLYFCGEVLDMDGVTGGFNFQAAWSTGFVAGKNASQKIPA